MTTPQQPTARDRRRRREHERQALVFGILIAILAVIGVGSLAVYTGAVESPFNRGFTTIGESKDTLQQPCVPDETMPVSYKSVSVTVLNASGRTGIATITGDMLVDRGFQVAEVGNALDENGNAEELPYTLVSSNAAGLAAAYTVAAQLTNSAVVLDDRPEPTVDVRVGANFDGLIPEDEVTLEADVPLTSPDQCTDVEDITPRHSPEPEPEATEEGADSTEASS
ncbi:LytR C-terminal domain-containing protein [Paraoerskovia marina]|uniref:LytR C-terminal domain-containing protein n=1 Tax=Paraoerskovia marina TaxID=545619 RepID=UPI0009F392F5|nr:LytR C-terminal domain-containing protein [Paraoerskovia marina]